MLVKFGHSFQKLIVKMFYEIETKGDGNCLFTAMRCAMEVDYVVKKLEKKEEVVQIILDATTETMVRAGLRLRLKVIDWYKNGLDTDIVDLGWYNQGDKRIWKRKDLLVLEMIRKGKDICENNDEERNRIALSYLLEMSKPGVWGSTPEYSAIAFMLRVKICIWQRQNGALFMINSVGNGEELHLRFSNNHYTCLITENQYDTLFKNVSLSKIAHMHKIK